MTFGDWDRGAEDALTREDSYNKFVPGWLYGLEPCWRGMCLYGMARKSGLDKYKKAAAKILKEVKGLVKKGCVNLVGYELLLEAENAVLTGKHKTAVPAFEDAIKVSVQAGFYQIAGMACERYALYLSELGDKVAAQGQLKRAIDFYARWGATKKVELLQQA